MALKKTLQKVGEWVEDVGKVVTGEIKAAYERGALRDTLEDFARLSGPIGVVFKLASRVLPESTAEQQIAAHLSAVFVEQISKARTDFPELCQVTTWNAVIRDKERGQDKANALLAIEFSWLSLFGRSGLRTSRSWPLVNELADVAEAWFSAATRQDNRLTPDNRRIIDAIRGRTADALAEAVEKLLQKPDVLVKLREQLDAAGRHGLELLAEELSTLHRLRLFGEVPQDELFIPPRIKCVDFEKHVPDGEIKWDKVPDTKGPEPVREQIVPGRSRLVVLFGDMGAGKSCLMRVLASSAAGQYMLDKKQPVVFVRWREIYENPNLLQAIAERVQTEYGLPADDLARQEGVAYFVDGFDEMSSHQNEVVWQLFVKLAKVVERGHTVVVAMRSPVVTTNIQTEWRERKAFVVRVLPFEKEEVNAWALRWQMRTADVAITGDRLRKLADEEVTTNPLLLFMLARYVLPLAADGVQLSRAEVFRTFVDETVSGKLQKSKEQFPLAPDMKDGYRLLLQEMAYLASWPKSNGKCSESLLKEMLTPDVCEKLRFQDVRTAFVLHFFDPGDVRQNEFEFQPEGFRQYLLAEWCARALLDVHQDVLDFKPGPFRRKRDDAMQALAQFPLREVERDLLNDLLTDLGQLAKAPDNLERRFRAFGISRKPEKAVELLRRVMRGLWSDAVTPPAHAWKPANVGIPTGQAIPDCLDGLRLLVNYWDQCLLGYFGLSRGLSDETPIPAPSQGNIDLGRFLRVRAGVRGHDWSAGLDLSRQAFHETDLRLEAYIDTQFDGADLSGILFRGAVLEGANLAGANLNNADLLLCYMIGAKLSSADLTHANLTGANLTDADLTRANLTRANLTRANLTDADLARANLTDANLNNTNLTGANLTGADLTGANLSHANLSHANLSYANLSYANLTDANLTGANLTDADLTDADLTDANLTDADLTDANLTNADLTRANLTDANLTNARLPRGFQRPPGKSNNPKE